MFTWYRLEGKIYDASDFIEKKEFKCCTVKKTKDMSRLRFILKGKHEGIILEFAEDALEKLLEFVKR